MADSSDFFTISLTKYLEEQMPEAILETLFRIHDDSTSDYLEIGYEPDSHETKDLIEIRSFSYNSLTNRYDVGNRLVIKVDAIDLVTHALNHFKKV